MTQRNGEEVSPTAQWLIREYGPLLSGSAAAKLLGFGTADALRQARLRRRVPVPMFAVEGRRGWFASTIAVATWIEKTAGLGGRSDPHDSD